MTNPNDISFTDAAGHPTRDLMNEYRRMAKADQRPIYVCKAGSHWVALEGLDPQRSESAYYYLHPGGLTAYGPDAEGEVRARLKG